MDQQPLAWWGGRCAGAAAREPGGRAAAHIHGRDLPHVPRVNVLVELVPARDVPEELAHVRDGADVPRRDVAVRRGCARRVDAPFDEGVLQAALVLVCARRRRWRRRRSHCELQPEVAADRQSVRAEVARAEPLNRQHVAPRSEENLDRAPKVHLHTLDIAVVVVACEYSGERVVVHAQVRVPGMLAVAGAEGDAARGGHAESEQVVASAVAGVVRGTRRVPVERPAAPQLNARRIRRER